MAALRSLTPQDRAEIELDLARTREQRQHLKFRLAELEARRAPRSFRGKLRYQVGVCERWIARYEGWLGEGDGVTA